MISATAPGMSISSLGRSYKAGVPPMDASLNEGKSQGLNRAIQRQTALDAGETSALQPHQSRQDVSAALELGRNVTHGHGPYATQALMSHFLVMTSNHAPGPKSASTLTAENNYRAARSMAVPPTSQTLL